MTRAAWLVAVAVLGGAIPAWASDFWLLNVLGQAWSLGIVALSLCFLAGQGGMVSLAQMTFAGMAGYTLALTSVNAAHLGWPLPPLASVPLAVLSATVGAALVGVIAARSSGIYLLMLTLALAMGGFFLVQQNVTVFNGFDGIGGIEVPSLPGGLSLRDPLVFYYLSLGAATLFGVGMVGVSRSPFGLTLQALRDSARKASALGFDVTRHRIAAFALSGLMAGVGGILYTWYSQRVSASTVGLPMINAILIMSVIGGLRHPLGAFVGALIYVLLNTFAASWVGAERFNTLLGSVFVAVVLLSPDGVVSRVGRCFRNIQRRVRAQS